MAIYGIQHFYKGFSLRMPNARINVEDFDDIIYLQFIRCHPKKLSRKMQLWWKKQGARIFKNRIVVTEMRLRHNAVIRLMEGFEQYFGRTT